MTMAGRSGGSALFGGSRIRVAPDPALRGRARRVTVFDDGLRELVDDMFEVMAGANGVGLAANQIGVDLAVFVMDCDGVRLAVVNPRLTIPAGVGWDTAVEGCLSLPGDHRPRTRRARADVVGQDEGGSPVTVHGQGLVARCLQHETDHLAGRLFTDPVRTPAQVGDEDPA